MKNIPVGIVRSLSVVHDEYYGFSELIKGKEMLGASKAERGKDM